MDHAVISLLTCFLAWSVLRLSRIGRRDRTLPPGPPTLPILGNIHLLPLQFTFLKISEWAKKYGGIMSLKVSGGTVIVISDMTIVREFLDDRASDTASRPSLYAIDAVTDKNYLAFATSDNPVWRMGRKAIHPLLTPQAVQAHLPVTEAETTQLLYDILHDPEHLYSHVSRASMSFMTSVVFGKPIPRHDSPDGTLFRDYMRHFLNTASPTAAPVDLVPILKYVPERWAPWKQLWKETRRLQQSLYLSLLQHAQKKDTDGRGGKIFINRILDRHVELKLSREQIGYIGGVLLDGGTETTSSFIHSLILSLTKFPAVMQKAQAEIDTVIGNTRLPMYSDIQDLPYIQAMIKETHRFRPTIPLSVPHASTNDFEYREYIIPKGVPILMNMWGIFHDPNLFERPDEFWPDRYLLTPDGTIPGLNKSYPIRPTLQFGSGKRICPGIHLANTNLSLTVMRLIWAFDFAAEGDSKDSSSQKKSRNFQDEYNDGITFAPKPFKFKITPRGKDAIDVIEESHRINALESGYFQT